MDYFNSESANLACEQQLKTLRQELLEANKIDQRSARPNANVSNFISTRPQIDSSKTFGLSVISLGSGPDIFLPLYLYPIAQNFFLIDILSQWGTGRDDVIGEIEARLQSLSPTTTVERVDSLRNFKSIEGPLPEPFVWRVQWVNSLGSFTKYFYLYQLNFEKIFKDKSLQAALGASTAEIQLGGIVITGVSASFDTRKFLLLKLAPGGSMYTEMIFQDELGRTTTPNDQAIIDELSKDFEVKDYGRKIIFESVRFNPHQFLITPKQ